MVEVVGEAPEIEVKPEEQLQELHYFTSAVYTIKKPEFQKVASIVSHELLNKVKKEQKLDEIYPIYQTENFANDPRLKDFTTYIAATGWNILSHQGYAMESFYVTVNEMWCQEHHKFSGQEEHLHGLGSQISGFYFLDRPENSTRPVIYDPRQAKKYANLYERDMTKATYASLAINFAPEPGMFMFMNSWLPHSFPKNASDQPFRFIHFNLGISYNPNAVINEPTPPAPAEVV